MSTADIKSAYSAILERLTSTVMANGWNSEDAREYALLTLSEYFQTPRAATMLGMSGLWDFRADQGILEALRDEKQSALN